MKHQLQRLWIQVTADKRKFGLLCLAGVVGLLLWGRLILTSNMPRTAIADPQEESAEARSDIASSLSRQTPSPVVVELSSTPVRDPFVISQSFFPSLEVNLENTGEEGKSENEPAENSDQVATLRVAQLRTLAAEMKLEAVLTSPPMAVINGRAYRQGSLISPARDTPFRFRLVEVRTRSVILECEGHRFELKIPTPQGDK